MTVYILSYNSYFNRIVKKLDSLEEYGKYIIYTESQLNFNPGDGCDTVFVAGRQGNPYTGSGNYLIYSEDDTSITSRWFIVEQTRNLKGQYTINLHRDTIVDSYDDVMNADMVVESAIIPDSNPLIYNSEPISVNQIKMDEQSLKDKTGCPWIVGYFDKNNGDKTYTSEIQLQYDEAIDETYESWISKYGVYYNFINSKVMIPFTNAWESKYGNIWLTQVDNIKYFTYDSNPEKKMQSNIYKCLGDFDTITESLGENFVHNDSTFMIDLKNHFYGDKYQKKSNLEFNNKICRFKTGTDGEFEYRKLTLNIFLEQDDRRFSSYDDLRNSSLNTFLGQNGFKLNDDLGPSTTYTQYDEVLFRSKIIKCYITSEVLTPGTYKATIKSNSTYLAKDVPYGIFAIPYGDIKVNNVSCHKDVGLSWAMSAYQQAGGNSNTFIYDVQLLPYCPCPEWIDENNGLTISTEDSYTYIGQYDGNGNLIENKSVIIYPKSQSFTFNIEYPIDINNKKIDSVCNIVRLCSPNYSGQFEFTPAKNNGVAFFNVDCTYLPYNPYIHINPNFDELYGKDYNDARGLICQGDFSLPVMNDAWISYQNSNKNYQNIFNREIDNMEVKRSYQLTQEKFQRHAQMARDFASGMETGSKIGGTGLGIGMGLTNLAISAYGAHLDKEISEGLYQESVSFAKDNFSMELNNIKAQPQSIGKTTAFTANNKIFPIVEFYSCTSQEKEFIANKIALNSMNVGIIGKPKDYVNNKWEYNGIKSKGFFKGTLLHADIEQDSHYLATLGKELALGGYYTWE